MRVGATRLTSAGERGFTLVELMVTVAIVAVLAAIAIPAFSSEARRSKSASEISPMFAELSSRQEQYRVDNGAYMTAAACPATPSADGIDVVSSCMGAGTDWATLRVVPPQAKVFCSYEITAGVGAGTADSGGFGFSSPDGSWFYIIATCDMDRSSSVNATYFMSSLDSRILKQNEGR